jgi:hypothetical protein
VLTFCGVVNGALLGFSRVALRERVGPLLAIDDDAPKRRRELPVINRFRPDSYPQLVPGASAMEAAPPCRHSHVSSWSRAVPVI